MVRKEKVKDSKLESFCIDFLASRGFVVFKAFDYVPGKELTEQDILKRFYFLNSRARGDVIGEGLRNGKADTLIIRKLINRFGNSGAAYEYVLQYIADLIDFLYEDCSRFGGPFMSFRIFSSDEFVEAVSFAFEKEREQREERIWKEENKRFSASRKVDMSSVLKNLKQIKESLDNA